MTELPYDLVVIGGGPAGMTAALTGAELGLRTALLDEQLVPGGQIYRNVTRIPRAVGTLLGKDYLHGEGLAKRLLDSSVDARFGAVVWDVDREFTVTAQTAGRSFQLRTKQLIAASGAMERPSPVPGWTLPGVFNAGAAQIALKTSSAIPTGRIVLVGGGPLLLLVACQLIEAGAEIKAIIQTSPVSNVKQSLRHLPGALAAPGYLVKGLRLLMTLRAAGVAVHRAATNVRFSGSGKVQAVSFSSGGKSYMLPVEAVLLHHGVVPNTQLSRLLRVKHHWDADQLAWRPQVDLWGETSLPGFRMAGDGAGIGGALAAESSGKLAALGAAKALGRLPAADEARLVNAARREHARQLRIRPFLDALYRPPEWLAAPADETIVCRCEEVTAGRVREMARLGCTGPNQTKFLSRCGMGPCQGRMCGLTVTQILAAETGALPQDVGAYRVRSPLKPVPLSSLAAMSPSSKGPQK